MGWLTSASDSLSDSVPASLAESDALPPALAFCFAFNRLRAPRDLTAEDLTVVPFAVPFACPLGIAAPFVAAVGAGILLECAARVSEGMENG